MAPQSPFAKYHFLIFHLLYADVVFGDQRPPAVPCGHPATRAVLACPATFLGNELHRCTEVIGHGLSCDVTHANGGDISDVELGYNGKPHRGDIHFGAFRQCLWKERGVFVYRATDRGVLRCRIIFCREHSFRVTGILLRCEMIDTTQNDQ